MSKLKDFEVKRKHLDYRREFRFEAVPVEPNGKMVLEGKAVAFEEVTLLFKWDGVDYFEAISKSAFAKADMKDVFFNFNHEMTKVLSRTLSKECPLEIYIKDDGLYFRATLLDIEESRDLYKRVQAGLIDKCSFAFSILEDSYDEESRTFTIQRVDRLYDVSAVAVPAYENTSIYARRQVDVEAQLARVEALELKRNLELAKARTKLLQT